MNMTPKARRRLKVGGVILVALGGIATIAHTLMRQTLGPLVEDVANARRKATFSGGQPPVDLSLISGNGLVEPEEPESRLSTDSAGRIAAIYVKEGQRVDAGTLLAELDNTVQRAQVRRAEADVAAYQAELKRIQQGMRPSDISAIAAEASAAKARAALAEGDFARKDALAGRGSIAPAELDQAKLRLDVENSTAAAAKLRAQGASAGARYEDVLIAQARLAASTAGLEEARGVLAKTQVLAPTSGQVLRVKFRVGEVHNSLSGEPLIIFGDTSALTVRMDVDERDIQRLHIDAPAYVTAPAFGARRFGGKLIRIGTRMGRRTVRADEPTDRIDVKVLEAVIKLDTAPELVPGMRVLSFVTTK